MIGETLGSYTVVKRLGAGGMGEVYLARHTRIDRQAAIKVLLPQMSSNQEIVDRFFSEARATSSIHHKGIVEVLDCDVHPSGRAYIVMELLEGSSLAGRLSADKAFGRDIARVLHVARAVADAVGAAHAKGIVHRDLKPDNVFLATDAGSRHGFVVKILDFGIAKLMGNDHDGERPISVKTRTGSLMGTPAYMSPEQCRGASRVDHRTDIYSLGCIVYEMLAGRLPFIYDGFGELISAHLHDTPPTLSSLGVRIPARVEDWLRRLLAKSPDQRFATMSEVASAARVLEAELDGMPVGAAIVPPSQVPTSMMPRTTTTFSEHASEIQTVAPPRPFRRGLLIGGLFAAAGIAAVVYLAPGPAAPPTASVPAPPAAAAVAPAEPEQVTLSISDAPDGLSVLVDGQVKSLPIAMPRGPTVHELAFKAPGYKDRVLRLDASTSRVVTLAMQPAVLPPAAPTTVGAPSHPARPQPATRSDAKRRRPRAAQPDEGGADDARKL